VIRTEELNDEVREVLDGVSAALSNEDVTELVGRIVIEGEDVASVARAFLVANDLA
jgi:glycine betaine/choline ABC-type transport system substrate-binding protein